MAIDTGKDSSLKPKLNIGTIGHIDHGKTTLTAAIATVLAKHIPCPNNTPKGLADIDRSHEERERGITINTTSIKYETRKFVCIHVDCPGHQDYIKNFVAGVKPMEAAILVVSALDGVCVQTREHISLIKTRSVNNVIVFLNKRDMTDEFTAEVCLLDVKQTLADAGFDPEKVQYVMGSAKCALEGILKEVGENQILALIDAIDNIPEPKRDYEGPFKCAIDKKSLAPGRGTVGSGNVLRGTVKVNDVVELHFRGKPAKKATVISIEEFKTQIPSASAGQSIGIILRGVDKEDFDRGAIISKPGTHQYFQKFIAVVYVQEASATKSAVRGKPFKNKFSPQFHFDFHDESTGRIVAINDDRSDKAIAYQGEVVRIEVELVKPTAFDMFAKTDEKMSENIRLSEGKTNIGAGYVLKVLE